MICEYFLLLHKLPLYIYIYIYMNINSDINKNVFNYSDAQVSSGQDPGDKEAAPLQGWGLVWTEEVRV